MRGHLPQYGRNAGGGVLSSCQFPDVDAAATTPFQINLEEVAASGQVGGTRPDQLWLGARFENTGDQDILLQDVEVRWLVSGPIKNPLMLHNVSISIPGQGSHVQEIPLLTSTEEREALVAAISAVEGLLETQLLRFEVELRFRGLDSNAYEVLTQPTYFVVETCLGCGESLGVTPLCEEAPEGWAF